MARIPREIVDEVRERTDIAEVVSRHVALVRKGRNLVADPRATVLVVDPADGGRWIEVRGDVELVTAGAVEVLDALTRAYTSKPAYYGHIAPAEFAGAETRVVVRLHPRRVNCDAIHR